MDVDQNKNNGEKLVRIISIIGGIISLIILIIIKVNVVGFKLGYFIFSMLFVVILCIVAIVTFHFMQKRKNVKEETEENLKKLPPAITLEQAREIAVKATQNPTYADYIPNCIGEGVQQLGKGVKSNVYMYKAKGLYQKDTYVVLINMHYPNQMRSIQINPSEEQIQKSMMLLANFPEDEPSMRKITIENPLLGTRQTTEEVLRDKKEDKPIEKKEQDI